MDFSSLPKATNIAESSSDDDGKILDSTVSVGMLTRFIAPRKARTSTRRSAIFGFYEPEVGLVHRDTDTATGVPHDSFRCYKCRGHVYRNKTTKDKSSGSGLRVHASRCYGTEAVQAAMRTNDLEGTRTSVKEASDKRQGTLTGMLKKLVDKGKEVYSTIALTKAEVR